MLDTALTNVINVPILYSVMWKDPDAVLLFCMSIVFVWGSDVPSQKVQVSKFPSCLFFSPSGGNRQLKWPKSSAIKDQWTRETFHVALPSPLVPGFGLVSGVCMCRCVLVRLFKRCRGRAMLWLCVCAYSVCQSQTGASCVCRLWPAVIYSDPLPVRMPSGHCVCFLSVWLCE